MTHEEAIKWVDRRLCLGRYTYTKHNPLVIDECFQAGQMAIDALEKQDRYKWHDLRKDPEDLPPIGAEVRVVILDTCDGNMKYAQDKYDYHDNSTSLNFLHHIRFRVIKWQYIEPFEGVRE